MGSRIFRRAGLAFCCRSRLSSNVSRHMNAPALALVLALAAPLSVAGTDTYHCEIKEQISVKPDGKSKVFTGPMIVDRKLSIHRKSGMRVGNAVGHFHAEGPRILSEGNAGNSFIAIWVGPSAGGGVHLDVLRVEEFHPGAKKPFVAMGGGTLFVGLCE